MGILEGGLVAVICFLLGRYLPARKRHAEKPPKPVCGCAHHYSFYDPETSECHGAVDEPTKFDAYGHEIAWKKVQCACRHYTGPEPLPEMYAPEISS